MPSLQFLSELSPRSVEPRALLIFQGVTTKTAEVGLDHNSVLLSRPSPAELLLLFPLFSRSGGGRWEKRAGVMRGPAKTLTRNLEE